MKKIDINKISVEDADEMFREATLSDEEKAKEWMAIRVGVEFRARHPEFDASNSNVALLDNYVHAMGLPVTIAGVEKAYEMLKAEGSIQ